MPLGTHDLVIIGAGPAGLSAAIQAKRLGLDLVVVERDRPGGQALAAYSIENYPGCPFGASGKQLMSRFTDHAKKLGIETLRAEASAVSRSGNRYSIATDGPTIESKAVIIATGLAPKRLRANGARDLEGTHLHYYVDPERVDHKGKRVLVIGSGDAAFDQAMGFADQASEITIAMRGATPRCLFLLTRRAERRGIRIMRSATPTKLTMTDDGIAVAFLPTGSAAKKSSWDMKADHVVACIGKKPDTSLLEPLIGTNTPFPLEPGPVEGMPTLYLAGDICRGNLRQISIAAGDGMRAAMDIYQYLVETSDDEHPFVHRG